MQNGNTPGARMKILIVDDHAVYRALLRNLLVKLPATVIECPDSSRALDLYTEHRPDWVITDLEMEPVDGLATTASLKRHHPEVRVLILTGHAADTCESLAKEAGAFGLFPKEHADQLLEFLRKSSPPDTGLADASPSSRQVIKPACMP